MIVAHSITRFIGLDFPYTFLEFFKNLNFQLLNDINDVYKKKYYSYQKMFNIKFLQLFQNNNFYL